MKSRNFAEKKTIVHRLTHKAYHFSKANKFEEKWETNHQQKLTRYRVRKKLETDEKVWETRM